MKKELYMVFDIESIGLHGEAFAVGWVVVDAHNQQLEKGIYACDPKMAKGTDESREWVKNNVPPLPVTCGTPRELRDKFWKHWMRWKEEGAVLAADCCWPVEARFLIACVDGCPADREWQGPYPLIDVASVALAAGTDPLGTFSRSGDELPVHNPLADAIQSARLLTEFLTMRPNLSAAAIAREEVITGYRAS